MWQLRIKKIVPSVASCRNELCTISFNNTDVVGSSKIRGMAEISSCPWQAGVFERARLREMDPCVCVSSIGHPGTRFTPEGALPPLLDGLWERLMEVRVSDSRWHGPWDEKGWRHELSYGSRTRDGMVRGTRRV